MTDGVAGVDIVACLQLELAAAGAFLAILQKEQEALIEGKIERLEALAVDKALRVGQLVELAEQRNRFLASCGLGPDLKGMEAWLAHGRIGTRPDARAAAAWRELLKIAHTVQQLNQTNGAIIGMQLQHNQQALAALLGAASNAFVYGPKGQTLGFSTSRALGQV